MNADPRRLRVESICLAALERPAEARAAYVREACGSDAALCAEVESLLVHADAEGHFLEASVGAVAAAVVPDATAHPSVGPGTRLGYFEVLAPLGAGGQGRVFRARDMELRRDVALKVLAGEPDDGAAARQSLIREARRAAPLSHPGICQVFHVGESSHGPFLVMELVDGRTVRDTLLGGPLPLAQVCRIGAEIARALDHAHAHGVVHRDLKSGNVMLTPDRHVKVLDFGIATIAPGSHVGQTLSSLSGAEIGRFAGTLPYMAPEVLRGEGSGIASDIWSSGVLLYEMTTGRLPFDHDTPSDLVAAILRDSPRPLPADCPPILAQLVGRCLAKDPTLRPARAGEVALALEIAAAAAPAPEFTRKPHAPGGWRRYVPWAIAAGSALGLALVAGSRTRQAADSARGPTEIRTSIALPSDVQLPYGAIVALSPDGSTVVYPGSAGPARRQLYMRRLSDTESTAIDGTVFVSAPFFSPDGEWLGFSGPGGLQKVPIAGGRPLKIADQGGGTGASWGEDGYIVFGRTGYANLFRVPAAGGTPEPLTKHVEGEDDHRWPQVLPGGRGVLFTVGYGPGDDARVVVLDARTGTRKDLIHGSASARYVKTGHLAYARGGALFVQPFDLDRLELVGPAVRLVEGVEEETNGAPGYAFSDAGSLVHVPGGSGAPKGVLTFVDLTGRAEPTAFPLGPVFDPRISPDGGRIAVTVAAARSNTWIYDVTRKTATRFTNGQYHFPVWMPDGRLTMATGAMSQTAIVIRASDSDGPDEEVVPPGTLRFPADWTRDGRTLFFEQSTPQTSWDLWMVSAGSKEAAPVVATSLPERHPRVSPDGRVLAYVSAQNQRWDVHVQSLAGRPQRQQVSVDGTLAMGLAWAPDGRRLYYRGADYGLWTVNVSTAPALTMGTPVRLFAGEQYDGPFDIAPDGKRFVMVRRESLPPRQQLQLVLNGLQPRSAGRR